ncbi:hypothetical protein ACFLV2_01955 [Chloroflexota bacterium]
MAKPQAIKTGFYVAICMEPDTAPCNCYIGLVQALDDYGIRLDLVHWDDKLDMIGGHTEDIFVPWMNIASMLVCTEEQPAHRFIRDKAPEWQAEVEAMRGGTVPVKAGSGKKVASAKKEA